jgi:hypothetical protein
MEAVPKKLIIFIKWDGRCIARDVYNNKAGQHFNTEGESYMKNS